MVAWIYFRGLLPLGRLVGCRVGTAVRALPRLQPAHPRPPQPAMATVRLLAFVVKTFEDLLAKLLIPLAQEKLQSEYLCLHLVMPIGVTLSILMKLVLFVMRS